MSARDRNRDKRAERALPKIVRRRTPVLELHVLIGANNAGCGDGWGSVDELLVVMRTIRKSCSVLSCFSVDAVAIARKKQREKREG